MWQVLQGNVNTYIAELREVDPPIIARRIRFVPYSVHPKPACMRVELYGCTWTGTRYTATIFLARDLIIIHLALMSAVFVYFLYCILLHCIISGY